MLKRHFMKSALALVLALTMIFPTFTMMINAGGGDTVSAQAAGTQETSLFDSVINLVSEKGAGIVKDSLPTVGDYLCAQVFDCLGIDYTDSYTKQIKEVNKKLGEIQNSLVDILKNQEKRISQNTMIEFYNTVDVFAGTVYPIYAGYSAMTVKEASGAYTKEQAEEEEATFYKNNLEHILFGSSTSTGDLYLQLKTLLEKITLPNVTTGNLSLMNHYNVTYEHLWAFDTQSFAPKREFLEYVSATALEGLVLYAFQNAYETKNASDTQKEIYRDRWARIKAAAEKAFKYLQKEINELDKQEQNRKDTNSVLHYASGKVLSAKLYVSKAFPTSGSNHYTYASRRSTTRQGNKRTVKVYALNNASFVDMIQSDFQNYKKNYNKDNNFTMAQFLQTAGFTCNDWNHSLYRKQRMKHEGSTLSNEYYKFYTSYVSQNGNSVDEVYWGDLKYKVFGSPTPRYYNGKDWSHIAFAGTDGILLGSYDEIYSDNGNTTVDAIYNMFQGNMNNMPEVFGKVE